jgi:predicted RNase H-like HicB family nuclease
MKSKGKKQVATTGTQDSYHYTVYFEPQSDGSFAVVFPTFPEIVTFGRTFDEARAMARDPLRCHLEGLRKDGEMIPNETQASRVRSPRKRNGVAILPNRRDAQLVTPEIVNLLRDET